MRHVGQDTLNTRSELNVNGKTYAYYDLNKVAAKIGDVSKLPFSLKILLENLCRFEDGTSVTIEDIKAVQAWLKDKKSTQEIAYRPARVLMQDFTGVPAVVDLAAMREAITKLGSDPDKINPITNVDLVIDHSVMVDEFGDASAFQKNVTREFERNGERYAFLKWGQETFDNFRVVPPGTGICHQVNLEYLAKTVWTEADQTGMNVAFPDTLVGTDSHTTMVNGLAVLGWGVGGIEAEAALLGQPVSMLIPEVVGFKLKGQLKEGVTATDLVLTVTQMLRTHGVVGKFVEFFGDGIQHLSLADRATIGNMAPEYGATCGIFPIDRETINYLEFTSRDADTIALVEAYAKAQGMWHDENSVEPEFTHTLELDLSTVEASLAGPKRPQDKIALSQAAAQFSTDVVGTYNTKLDDTAYKVEGHDYTLSQGDVVIAAITSCTNTSNPDVMVAAGLLARNAVAKGLTVKPWVKTSLAPGSQVVTDYLNKAELQKDLDTLGFNLVGYGCTTCIGNSGPLEDHIAQTIDDNNLIVTSVLSGNRNFEGRINPHCKANYLASPPLVVAYALAGSMTIDITKEPLGQDPQGNDVYLKDIWPTNDDIHTMVKSCLTPEMFAARYADVFKGPTEWQAIPSTNSKTYDWQPLSTYVKNPPLFDGMEAEPSKRPDIIDAYPLAILGDSVTTDHISPAGSIMKSSPAGEYLTMNKVPVQDFNSYGSRRGNHEVMMRGTFANIRIKNEMLDGVEGGYTKHIPTGEEMPIFTAAMKYQIDDTPLVVVAGKEYGTGSSRDWAAKGTRLLGVKAVIAESFERIHRSNLIGMGVLPLQFTGSDTRKTLGLTGAEKFTITGMSDLSPKGAVSCVVTYASGETKSIELLCRLDTIDELAYFNNDGILQYVLRNMAKTKVAA
jgi:aconitate hydratase